MRGNPRNGQRLRVRVEKIALALQCDAALRKRGVGANSSPVLPSIDYDFLPHVAEEHSGQLLIEAARLEYPLKYVPDQSPLMPVLVLVRPPSIEVFVITRVQISRAA